MKNLILSMALLLIIACGNDKSDRASSDQSDITDAAPAVPTLVKKWETDTLLTTSESIVFDAERGVYYVSCIGGVPPGEKDGDGFIARIDQQGKIIGEPRWITGMDAPKGLGLVGSTLYATDIDEVILADVLTGQITNRITIEGATFLNDVAIRPDNSVYVTDTDNNTIHKVEDNSTSVYLVDEQMGGLNGAWFDASTMMVVGFQSGEFRKYDMGASSGTVVADSIFGGDGIEKMGDAFYVSSWNGEVYHVDQDGNKSLILDTKADEINAADIETVPSQNLLLVPTFFGNTIAAYEVSE